jgi:hypothetical protein
MTRDLGNILSVFEGSSAHVVADCFASHAGAQA